MVGFSQVSPNLERSVFCEVTNYGLAMTHHHPETRRYTHDLDTETRS